MTSPSDVLRIDTPDGMGGVTSELEVTLWAPDYAAADRAGRDLLPETEPGMAWRQETRVRVDYREIADYPTPVQWRIVYRLVESRTRKAVIHPWQKPNTWGT